MKAINGHKSYSKQIKPFNFVLVGQPTEANDEGTPIHPITKFTKRMQEAPFQSFIDYNTGRRYPGGRQLCWKTLQSAIHDYLSHPERKFTNGKQTGKMKRRWVQIENTTYIGKEATEIEESETFGTWEESYVRYRNMAN